MAGESSRSLQYRKPADQAYADLTRAFQRVGKVESASEATLTVRGKTSYGLQSVSLRVSIIEKDENNSLLQIQAAGDDVWAGGARGGADRLIQALENPDYILRKPKLWLIFLCIALAGLLMELLTLLPYVLRNGIS